MTTFDIESGDNPTPPEAETDEHYVHPGEEVTYGDFDLAEAAMAARRVSELEAENEAKDQEIENLKEAIAAHEFGKAVAEEEIAKRDEAIAAHEFHKAVTEEELASTHEKKREAETLDSLTGLLNVKGIKERAQAILDAERNFGVLYIDLADFKAINDKFGHDAGDEVLKKVAEIIAHDIRTSQEYSERALDAVARIEESNSDDPKHPARLHGDEFLIVVDGGEDEAFLEDTLTIVRDRILADIEAMKDDDPNLVGINFGADLGMTTYDAMTDTTVEDTIKRADANMRFMKRRRQSREGSYR